MTRREELVNEIEKKQREIAELRREIKQIDLTDLRESDIDEEFKKLFESWFKGVDVEG